MTTQPSDTDPSVIAHPVFRYSEWLDSQKLMRSPAATGDDRSHARLAADFLAQDAKTRADEEQAARIKRGAAELGKIVQRQCRDVLAAIGGAPDLIDETGDGDWEVVWERLAEQCAAGRKALGAKPRRQLSAKPRRQQDASPRDSTKGEFRPTWTRED